MISVVCCSERCDAARSTRVSRETKSSVSNHPWPDCCFRCKSCRVAILRVVSEGAQAVRQVSALPVLRGRCSPNCIVAYFSTTTLSGIFAFSFSATAMIRFRCRNVVSTSQQTNCSRGLSLCLQDRLWLLLSLPILHACSRCLRRQLPDMYPDLLRLPPSSARALVTTKSIASMSRRVLTE